MEPPATPQKPKSPKARLGTARKKWSNPKKFRIQELRERRKLLRCQDTCIQSWARILTSRLTLEGEQKNNSSVGGFQPLNHNKQSM